MQARSTFRALSLMLAITFLGGCGSGAYVDHSRDGGISIEEGEALIESVDGVTNATFTTAEWSEDSTFGELGGMDLILEVSFEPTKHLEDSATALLYLAHTAWSINSHWPSGHFIIVFDGGVSPNTKWTPIAMETLTWGQEIQEFDHRDYIDGAEHYSAIGLSGVAISTSELKAAFGEWPSEPPANLDLRLADGPPETILPPALDKTVLVHNPDLNGSSCWIVTFWSSNDALGEWEGSVEIEIKADGKSYIKETTKTRLDSHWLCNEEILDSADRVTAVFTPIGQSDRFDMTPIEVVAEEP